MFKRFLKSGDIFGSSIKFYFDDEEEHTTVMGGVVTILINLMGLAYGLYMLISWCDGKFLPMVQTTQVEINDQKMVDFKYNPIEIYIDTYHELENKTLRFEPSSTNFSSYFAKMYNKNIIDDKQYTNQSNFCQQNAICLRGNDSLNQNYQVKYSKRQGQQSILFSILPCDTGDCTLKNRINMTDGKDLLRFKYIFYVESYDISSGKVNLVPKSYIFLSNFKQMASIQFVVKISKIQITGGQLFPQKQYLDIVSDVEILTSFLADAATETWGLTRAMIHMDETYNEVLIVEMNLSQLMAQVFSVFSALYMVEVLITNLSSRRLQNKLKYEILKIYYPRLKNTKIELDIWGRVKSIKGEDDEFINEILWNKLHVAQRYLNIGTLFEQIKIFQSILRHLVSQQNPNLFLELIHRDNFINDKTEEDINKNIWDIPLIELFLPESTLQIYNSLERNINTSESFERNSEKYSVFY